MLTSGLGLNRNQYVAIPLQPIAQPCWIPYTMITNVTKRQPNVSTSLTKYFFDESGKYRT